MKKLAIALLLSTLATVLSSCGRDGVTGSEVEQETRRAIERGESFVERKTARAESAVRDRFVRFEANQKDVRELGGELRDDLDNRLDGIERAAKQLEQRFQDVRDDAELRDVERELDRLQRSLDKLAHEIREGE